MGVQNYIVCMTNQDNQDLKIPQKSNLYSDDVMSVSKVCCVVMTAGPGCYAACSLHASTECKCGQWLHYFNTVRVCNQTEQLNSQRLVATCKKPSSHIRDVLIVSYDERLVWLVGWSFQIGEKVPVWYPGLGLRLWRNKGKRQSCIFIKVVSRVDLPLSKVC